MAHLINKDRVVAEIEKRIRVCQDYAKCNLTENTRIGNKAQELELNYILSFINNLEVKEVDLEKALSDLDREIKEFITTDEFEKDSAIGGHYWAIAKHAFLLGIQERKGE